MLPVPPLSISVENLSKLYRLGQIGTGTLSHDLNRWWHRVRGKPDPYQKLGHLNDRTRASDSPKPSKSLAAPEYVWALQDIDLQVEKGTLLGIIGPNGAGKSTLLKLLSRITSPTRGTIKARGRIASLLEVGTGFHPELTGRENIFLNGAILGMRRSEIARRLDEIVEFSGCAKYLDTPVKRYSSGMMVRLGFSVAAHLECEILIVDEVLAVGDAEFQKRCLNRLSELSGEARTVLFVSHNLAAVQHLCSSAVVLRNGTITYQGDVTSAIAYYNRAARLDDDTTALGERTDRQGTGAARVVSLDITAVEANNLRVGDPWHIRLEYECKNSAPIDLRAVIGVYTPNNESLLRFDTRHCGQTVNGHATRGVLTCVTAPIYATSGQLFLNVALFASNVLADYVTRAKTIHVQGLAGDVGHQPFDRSECLFSIPSTWTFHD